MIVNIELIIDKILYAAGNKQKSIIINEYINEPVRKQLAKQGYKLEENRGTYTIRW